MYELILIDADETLFDFVKAEKIALKITLESFGFAGDFLQAHELYKVINKALWKDLEKGLINNEELRLERFKRLLENLQLDYSPFEFSEQYALNLGNCSFLLEGALEVCIALHKKYKVLIVTNGMKDIQHSRIDNSLIKNYIDGVVISEEVGFAKPDTRIFDCALKMAKHEDKRTVLMVGDALSSDIKGAIDYGVDSCWLNTKKVVNESELKPSYVIDIITDLLKIVSVE